MNYKFLTKRMKELFMEVSEKSMVEQGMIFETTFENWRGEVEQTDDVTVMGIRI